jgi:Ca2+-dependent lipid-binding protein
VWTGVHRILAALQDPTLFKMCMPTSLVEDQDWVQLTESWTESFTREQELTPWLNKILMVMWPFLNEIIAQVVEQMVEPLIQEQLTPDVPITRVEFTTFSLGTIAPQVRQD